MAQTKKLSAKTNRKTFAKQCGSRSASKSVQSDLALQIANEPQRLQESSVKQFGSLASKHGCDRQVFSTLVIKHV